LEPPLNSLHQTLSDLPKIDLHRHLEGSLRLSTLLEIAQTEDIDAPQDEKGLQRLVQMHPADVRSPAVFLGKFVPLRSFYRSPKLIQRYVREAIADAAADRVIHLEMQFTPTTLARLQAFALADIMDWVTEAAKSAAEEHGVSLGLIAGVNRHDPVEQAEIVAQLAVDRLDKGIVGVGLAGNEVDFSAEPFEDIFREIRSSGLRTTVHAGEWTGPETIRHAIEKMGAERIGHGISIIEDRDTLALARDRGMVFEVCISSNLDTGIIAEVSEHPLLELILGGLKATLNTDDPGISATTLSAEYALAVEKLGLSITSLKGLILTAAQAAFLGQKHKKRLERKLQAELF
jgi:adenosine deaminase